MKPHVLATDLDGTLIPLEGNRQNQLDLRTLETEVREVGMKLAFVSGRHFASVAQVMADRLLPAPDWIIGDVGTSIYVQSPRGYERLHSYSAHLHEILDDFPVSHMTELLSVISELRLQEEEKQSSFKLSYYLDREALPYCTKRIAELLDRTSAPYSFVASVDPFTGEGLLDLLPKNASKAYALDWWSTLEGFDRDAIIYAGDSGNDSAVFASGFRSIVVANAAAEVLDEARRAHAEAGWRDRLFAAPAPATSGVLAGLRHFL